MKDEKNIPFGICIPTFNRPTHLENCLNSILISHRLKPKNFTYEICISDNGSEKKHNIKKIINKFKYKLPIKINYFKKNKGIGLNYMKVVEMSRADFVWMLGNDDLILPNTLADISKLLKCYSQKVDFIFLNSYNLEYKFISKFKHPFNTIKLPGNMERCSSLKNDKILNFWELIDPKISFDYLLAAFFSLFRREMWLKNTKYLNINNLKKMEIYSTKENTFFHTIIFANAFNNSKAFFSSKPLSVNLSGVREWTAFYAFICNIRIPEILDYYRSRGLPFLRYIYCKNYSLKDYSYLMFKIFFSKKTMGKKYFNFYDHLLRNLLYPNSYLSFFFYMFKKANSFLRKNKIIT